MFMHSQTLTPHIVGVYDMKRGGKKKRYYWREGKSVYTSRDIWENKLRIGWYLRFRQWKDKSHQANDTNTLLHFEIIITIVTYDLGLCQFHLSPFVLAPTISLCFTWNHSIQVKCISFPLDFSCKWNKQCRWSCISCGLILIRNIRYFIYETFSGNYAT